MSDDIDPLIDALDTLEELKGAIAKLAAQRDHYASILHTELTRNKTRHGPDVGDQVRVDELEQTWTVQQIWRDGAATYYHLEDWPDVNEHIPASRITACVFAK